MSLHKFAEQVAANGRGEDSLLVHMTPDEVRKLQQFAEANGTTLTINPHTGLPEAGLLSDFFKMVAPVALGAFLGPAGMGVTFGGLSSAASAGLLTGGITSLATGSLSRGLMAGLGAYGGAGLGAGLESAGLQAEVAAGLPTVPTEGLAQADIPNYIKNVEAARGAAIDKFGGMSLGDKLSSGIAAAADNPMNFAKQNLGNIAAAAAPIMAGAMVPTTTKMPADTSPAYIRQKLYDPYTQTYKSLAPVKASEWGSRSFSDAYTNPQTGQMATLQPRAPSGMAGGGIVALAGGGVPGYAGGALVSDQQIFDYFASGPKSDEQIARDMGTYNVTTADIARATGTQSQQADYDARYAKADTKNDIYDYFANADTQALLKSGNDKAIADTLQANDWKLADVAAATGTQNLLGDYGTRYVNAVSDRSTDANEFLARANDVGLTGADLATALQNSGQSAAAQYALTHNLADTKAPQTDFYNQFGYTTGALPGDQGGLEGLYANINYSASGLQSLIDSGKMTVAQAQDAALAEMNRIGVNAKDIKAATGKSFGDLFKPKIDTKTKIDTIKGGTGNDTITGGTGNDVVLPPPFVSVVPGNTVLSSSTIYPNGAVGTYGNNTGNPLTSTPGDIITNPDGTRTVVPNLPGRPYGGYSGLNDVRNAYTAGGGSLGYTSKAPRTIAEFNQLYNKQTGDSLAAYDYLMGKGAYPTRSKAADTATGIMQPYFSGSMRYKPKFLSYDKEGNVVSSSTSGKPADAAAADLTKAKSIEVVDSSGETTQTYTAVLQEDGTYLAGNGKRYDVTGKELAAGGGMMGYAVGGGLGSLGSYSDGGRLLKGPGDGVSDSIPATIGAKQQPARLADGEFVIPARIVSELGNGSTDAGAKKLYAMMDRVQKARGKTTGKNKVAANSRADKYLPA